MSLALNYEPEVVVNIETLQERNGWIIEDLGSVEVM